MDGAVEGGKEVVVAAGSIEDVVLIAGGNFVGVIAEIGGHLPGFPVLALTAPMGR